MSLAKLNLPILPDGEKFLVYHDGLVVTVAVAKDRPVAFTWIDRMHAEMNPHASEQDVDRRILDVMRRLAERRHAAAVNLPKWLKKWR